MTFIIPKGEENMIAFIAYRHTGEDPKALEVILSAVRDAFLSLGIEVSCTFFDVDEKKGDGLTEDEIMEIAFRKIDKSSFMFVLQASAEKSEGMLMEVGYCIGTNVPMIIATRRGIGYTYLPKMSKNRFCWSTTEELMQGIKKCVLEAQLITA